jgi:hypothetical protein
MLRRSSVAAVEVGAMCTATTALGFCAIVVAAPCTIRTARSTPLSVSITFLSSRHAPDHVPPITCTCTCTWTWTWTWTCTLSSAGFHRSWLVLAAIQAPLNTLASACRAGILPVIRIATSIPASATGVDAGAGPRCG